MLVTKAALDLSKSNHVRSVYLLAETAATLFSKIGFALIPRSEVPQEVQQSVEFTTLRPETAMSIALNGFSRALSERRIKMRELDNLRTADDLNHSSR